MTNGEVGRLRGEMVYAALKMQHGRMSGRGLGWAHLMRRREAQPKPSTEYILRLD